MDKMDKMDDRINQLKEYVLRVYSKYDVCNSAPSYNSHQRSFDEGIDTGESRMAYNVAKILGLDIEEPEEEINFHVESLRIMKQKENVNGNKIKSF